MKQIRSFGLLIFTGVLWWGLAFPELCFMEGTYEIVEVTAADAMIGNVMQEEPDELEGLFEAGPEKIIVKSKLMRN
ncbi:MAG: hypothetical protein IJN54_10035 [Lachnospiraceae bacterium]|nr:hypothetical protein [Lachnospiraceae bacterium]